MSRPLVRVVHAWTQPYGEFRQGDATIYSITLARVCSVGSTTSIFSLRIPWYRKLQPEWLSANEKTYGINEKQLVVMNARWRWMDKY